MIASALDSPQQSILILGGEPLLMLDKVIEFVTAIRPYKKEIYVTTSLPRTLVKQPEQLLHLVGMLDGLNVSFQHHDWQRNNEILSASNKYNRVEFLGELLAHEDFARKVRVSVNLVKGGVDNAKDLNAFLDLFQQMGCRHVKVNELQSSSDKYVSFENIMNVKLPSPFAHGCQTDEPLRDGMRVTLKRSCFIVEETLTASPADLMKITVRSISNFTSRGGAQTRNGVMYENGSLETGWITEEPSLSSVSD